MNNLPSIPKKRDRKADDRQGFRGRRVRNNQFIAGDRGQQQQQQGKLYFSNFATLHSFY